MKTEHILRKINLKAFACCMNGDNERSNMTTVEPLMLSLIQHGLSTMVPLKARS
jgi:hypothetical protein